MTEPVNETGLGVFLKSERERKGLTLEQLAKITKLRIQYVEALENEDWDMLPSPVFIKGFIKSYTKVLGLDYREVIGQFQSYIPVHDDLPKPLVPPKKKGTGKTAILITVGVIIALLLVVFIISDPVSRLKKTISDSGKITEDRGLQNEEYTADNDQGRKSIQDSALEGISPETGLSAATKPGAEPAGPDIQYPDIETAPLETEAVEQVQPPAQTAVKKPAAAVEGRYTLTAYVMERTYIKIYVDNEPPREFIFSPGSYPQWTGDEGFFLLIGNAAGVEFDFNGEIIKDLGDEGDVVRLRLPEDFNMDINE